MPSSELKTTFAPTRLKRARNNRGFTLIELLVIIGIMGLMVTVGIVSVRSGRGAARVKGATRDVFAAIRHARSTALVTGEPAVITYSTESGEDGEVVAKIEVNSAKLFKATVDRSKIQTLSGKPLEYTQELVHVEPANEGEDEKGSMTEDSAGETIEDVLFAPISADIVSGMRLKVEIGDASLASGEPVRKSKLSVFSSTDYLLSKFKTVKANSEKKEEKAASTSKNKATIAASETQEPVSVVWETNGRVDPHRVWVYADGHKPEDGLCIVIDPYGAAKVISGDGREDE